MLCEKSSAPRRIPAQKRGAVFIYFSRIHGIIGKTRKNTGHEAEEGYETAGRDRSGGGAAGGAVRLREKDGGSGGAGGRRGRSVRVCKRRNAGRAVAGAFRGYECRTGIRAHACACAYARTHARTHACTHARTYTGTDTCAYARTNARTYACIHARTDA